MGGCHLQGCIRDLRNIRLEKTRWVDGWMDGKTVLSSGAGTIFGAGVNNHNDSPKHK